MGDEAAVRAGGEQVRLLYFRCCGERFALDVAYVREILPRQEITPVPFVPETVAGIINHRGTIYTLVRFSRLAGFPGDSAAGVVLLRLPEMAVGFTVDEIEGIETVSGRLLADAGAVGAGPTDVRFLRRSADERGRLVHAVDADVLIDIIYQLPDLARPGEA